MSAGLSRIAVFAAVFFVATALPRLPDKPGQAVRLPKKVAEGPKAVSRAVNVEDTITTQTQVGRLTMRIMLFIGRGSTLEGKRLLTCPTVKNCFNFIRSYCT